MSCLEWGRRGERGGARREEQERGEKRCEDGASMQVRPRGRDRVEGRQEMGTDFIDILKASKGGYA